MSVAARARGIHFALRGWLSAALFAVLAAARHSSAWDLRPAWLLLIAAGAAWRVQAARYIGDHSNRYRMAEGPLSTAGPYALGRHPLYLSNLAVAFGLVLFAHCLPWWGEALLLAAVAANYALLARAEEMFLLARLGEPYASYLRATPRWLGFPGNRGLAAAAPSGLSEAMGRQAGNLLKAAACVAAIWALARHA
jgi:protein-S-isoprenylcysteine O-methyltransferase Ste14